MSAKLFDEVGLNQSGQDHKLHRVCIESACPSRHLVLFLQLYNSVGTDRRNLVKYLNRFFILSHPRFGDN